MSRDDTERPPAESTPRDNVARRRLTPDPSTAEYDFLEIVAELEGCRIDELPSLYDQLDHFVETLFESPPAPESQLEIEFTYAGYRITMDQLGHVKLVNTKPSIE